MKKKKTLIYFFKLGLEYLLSREMFQITISLITLVLVSTTVYKAVTFKNEIRNLEKNIEQKIETNIKIEHEAPIINNEKGVNKITSCLKTPLTKEEMNPELININNSLEKLFNESNYNFAFKYKDIYTGFSLSYNSSQPIFAASTIKAPEAIYIYEQAEKGNINLDDTLTYTSNYYNGGTGVLKNTKFNVDYTIHTLVGYSIIHSDNAAHNMLNNKYKSENMYNYWSNLGTTTIFKERSNWGAINANDGTITMEELYKYLNSENKYKEELGDYFIKSWSIIKSPNNSIVYNKTGWSNYSLHDLALIMDDNPYTLVILTNRGYTEYQSLFDKTSDLVYNFHKEYWKQKINNCTK